MEEPGSVVESSTIRCRDCGYDLSGTAVGSRCPECGLPVSMTLQPVLSPHRPMHQGAVWCVVLGALSLGCCGLLGPIAVLLYLVNRGELQSGMYSRESTTMATIGLVLGSISTALLVVLVVGQAFQ